ncbi:hypothetical protein ACYF6T_44255 [Streptomyces sp. 7R007]
METGAAGVRGSALGRLGSTPEAEEEARRTYKTEQNRRWFRADPNSADAVAAATKAADAAWQCTAEYLLTVRLEQLRERTLERPEQAASAPWSARLTELAARALGGEAARPATGGDVELRAPLAPPATWTRTGSGR